MGSAKAAIRINVNATINDRNMQLDSAAAETCKKIPPASPSTTQYAVPFRWEESPGRPRFSNIAKPNYNIDQNATNHSKYINYHPNHNNSNNKINRDYNILGNSNPDDLSSKSSMQIIWGNNYNYPKCSADYRDHNFHPKSFDNNCNVKLKLPPKLQYYYYCYHNHLYCRPDSNHIQNPKVHESLDRHNYKNLNMLNPNSASNHQAITAAASPAKLMSRIETKNIILPDDSSCKKIPTDYLSKSGMESLQRNNMLLRDQKLDACHHMGNIDHRFPGINPSNSEMRKRVSVGDDHALNSKNEEEVEDKDHAGANYMIHDRFFFHDKLSSTSLGMNQLTRCNIVSSTLDSWSLNMSAGTNKAAVYCKKEADSKPQLDSTWNLQMSYKNHAGDPDDSRLDSAWIVDDHQRDGIVEAGGESYRLLHHSQGVEDQQVEALGLMVRHGNHHHHHHHHHPDRAMAGSRESERGYSPDPADHLNESDNIHDQYVPPSPWILGFSPDQLPGMNQDNGQVRCINMVRKKSNHNNAQSSRNQVLATNQASVKITNRLLRLEALAKLKAMVGKAISTSYSCTGVGGGSSNGEVEGECKSANCGDGGTVRPYCHGQADHMWSPTLATYLYNQQQKETATDLAAGQARFQLR